MITDTPQQFVQWFLEHRYLSVFLSAAGVFPSEIVIASATMLKPTNILLISFIAALGGVAGGTLTYSLGYFLSKRNSYNNLVNGKSEFLGIDKEKISRSKEKILRHGYIYILVSRFLPWVRVLTTLVSGILQIRFLPFLIIVFLGTFIYSLPIAYIGARVGSSTEDLQRYITLYNKWIIGAVVLYILRRVILILYRKVFTKKQ